MERTSRVTKTRMRILVVCLFGLSQVAGVCGGGGGGDNPFPDPNPNRYRRAERQYEEGNFRPDDMKGNPTGGFRSGRGGGKRSTQARGEWIQLRGSEGRTLNYEFDETLIVKAKSRSLDPFEVVRAEFTLDDWNGTTVMVTMANHGDGTYTGEFDLGDLPSSNSDWRVTVFLDDDFAKWKDIHVSVGSAEF